MKCIALLLSIALTTASSVPVPADVMAGVSDSVFIGNHACEAVMAAHCVLCVGQNASLPDGLDHEAMIDGVRFPIDDFSAPILFVVAAELHRIGADPGVALDIQSRWRKACSAVPAV